MHNFEFRAGQIIEIEYRKSINENFQFRTLIELCHGNTEFLILAPMYKATLFQFQENDDFEVVFVITDDDGKAQVYGFKARVIEKIRKEEMSFLRIVRISGFKKKQRRSFYRLNYVADMILHIPKGEGEEPEEVAVLTKDISAGGLRGIASKYIPSGTEVVFYLDLGVETMEIPSRIIVCKRIENSILKSEVRVEFVGMGTRDTERLIQHINRLQTEYIKRMNAEALERRLARYGHEEPKFVEHRVRIDWILKWLDISVALSWLLTLIIGINFLLATPQKQNIIQHYYGYPVRYVWDLDLIRFNRYFVVGLLGLSCTSLALNTLRRKRKEDHFRYSFIITGILALIILLLYSIFL